MARHQTPEALPNHAKQVHREGFGSPVRTIYFVKDVNTREEETSTMSPTGALLG